MVVVFTAMEEYDVVYIHIQTEQQVYNRPSTEDNLTLAASLSNGSTLATFSIASAFLGRVSPRQLLALVHV